MPFVGKYEEPQALDQAKIIGFAEDFFLGNRVRHLNLFQLLAQPLLLVKLGVDTLVAYEFVVTAALDNLAFVEDEDFIGLFDGGDAVRNNQASFFPEN
jgi:hypothetical protein